VRGLNPCVMVHVLAQHQNHKIVGLPVTVSSLVRSVMEWIGARVAVRMGFVYLMVEWMETGVNGDLGVPAVMERKQEEDNVTTHHLAMEVHSVLGLQLRQMTTVQKVPARLIVTVTSLVRPVMGWIGEAVAVRMGGVYHRQGHQPARLIVTVTSLVRNVMGWIGEAVAVRMGGVYHRQGHQPARLIVTVTSLVRNVMGRIGEAVAVRMGSV